MKTKHLLMTLLLALLVPWAANAQQDLSDYTFSTGTDATKWISLSDQATTLLANAKDDVASSKTAIGFTFPFGEGSYTEFWVNSNGIFSFNSTTSTARAPQFNSSNYTANQPKICGVTKDLTTGSDGYVKSELIGTTPNRILVCEFFADNYNWSYSSTPANFKWQIQLHESGSKVIIVYGTNLSSAPSEYQIGLSPSSSDILTINPSTHETAAGSTATTYSVWPGENRYYEFDRPAPPCCPKPTDLTCTGTTTNPTTATFTWTNGGEETQWVLEYSTASDFTGATSVTINQSELVNGAYTLTGLTAETKYYGRIKAYCPSCDPNYSNPSNVVSFEPTNAIPYSVYDDPTTLTTNSYVPIYGNWQDRVQQSEYIIPAEELANLADGKIKAIKLYPNYNFTSTQTSWQVYVREVENATFSNTTFYGIEGSTVVYSGGMSYTSAEGLNVTFNDGGYTYNGGNLLIGFYQGTAGNCVSGSFNGQDVEGASLSCYGTNTPSQRNFIPKTTFTYLPSPTPKPTNLHVVDGSLWSGGATLAWEAPSSATPTSYEYCYKTDASAWSAWESTPELSVALNLSSSTHYTFRVRANYAEGNSNPVETDFTTLDDCAFPTNLLAYTVPGQGTKATLTWVKGYDEEAWVLQYGTDANFTDGTYTEKTSGFIPQTEPGLENVVAAVLTDLTAETKYYARVKANCGGGSTSEWSNVVDFTPTYYVDFPYNANATSTVSYTPFYGSYAAYGTHSRFIIPSSSLADLAGGTVKKLTFYSSATTADWGAATFKVYVAEVEASSFTSNPSTSTPFDWSDMTQVFSGTLSLANGEMVILLDEPFVYSGTKNLMIGFEETSTGTNATAAWYYKSGVSNSCAYAYKSYASATSFSTSRGSYSPKMTFNYLPTPYQKIAAINEGEITTTTAELTWTAPVTTATITGYAYQYKLSSAAEWPTAWSNLAASATSVTLQPLTPGTSYDFQIKVLYGEHESVVNSTSFFTACGVVTAFPWKEDFEAYAAGNFSHPCWVNQHLSGDGSYLYSVVTESMGDNNTKKLKLNDQSAGTETMLRLPEMNLPGNDYQFVIDVYRNTSTYQENPYELEGIHVYVSTNGNLEGATELAYIPRHKDVSNSLIPAEEETGWYTYEIPVGISGNCYIILKGVNQWCTSIYMDNFGVEQIPTCARPSELAYSNVTNHSAKLSWTAGDTEQTLWQVAYSKTTFDPNTASFDVTTVNTVDATANPFVLAGLLDAESTYYMYVRANCGTATEPDYGPWSRKGINFTTLAATPAPSNFVASNPASEKVDLVWNAGGGDFESWELYYKASETAPEAPTATTTATVANITTLPTTEAPYVLEGLDPVTKYYAWIRAKHVWDNETTYSDWVALTGSYFETLDACPTPTNLVATNLTSVSADLSWVGSDDVTEGYTVEYGEEGSYSVNETEDFSGLTTAGYSSEGVLPEGWKRYNSNPGYMPHVSDASACGDINEFGTGNNYLLMTQNKKDSDQYLYAIMPQINNLGSFEFKYVYESTSYGVLSVGYVTDNTNYSTFQVLQTPEKSATIATCTLTADNIATINANNGYVTFRYEGNYNTYYSVGIDDIVYKGGTYTPGPTQQVTTDEQNKTLSDLTPNKTYIAKVKSNCTNGEWSNPVSFTTLTEGKIVFTNASGDGLWSTAANWTPNAPAISDTAILRANATIASGTVATAKKITFEGTPTPTLTINDGGQLQTDNTVTATVKKNITGYGAVNEETNLGYYFISNPLNSTINSSSFASIGLITTNSDYDLYRWSTGEGADYLEWRNFKASSFNLQSVGYLYANAADVVLTFTGTVRANHERSGWTPTQASYSFGNWNLYGNPFVCNAYLVNSNNISKPYYKMNEAGDGFEAVIGEAIPPVTGLFYDASESGESVYFTRDLPAMSNQGHLNINMAQNVNMRGAKGSTDNAIIVFGESQQMGKFSFREGSSKVYIPMEGKDYAVVNAEGKTGEIPVSFKAEKNGSYTLSFTSQEVSFSYLHLIDNLTGNDVDLLANPSYNFDAQTTDYASRFRLVFATGSSVDGDNFAFINGMGNLSIFGIEGEATVQVIDVLGRVLSSDTFSGSYEQKLNVAPGVYMIRLINGNDIKVQKMIVK